MTMPPDKTGSTTVGTPFNFTSQVEGETKAQARARIMAEEEARIEAAGGDRWYYIQGGEQVGPVSLVDMRTQISDLSIRTPVKSVWTEGMENWKPVYEVKKLCEPLAAPLTKPVAVPRVASNKMPTAEELEAEAKEQVIADAAAAEVTRAQIQVAAENEKFRRAVEEIKLKASEEARVAAAERVMQEAQSDLPTEVTAAKKAELRATLKTNAARQAIYTAAASTGTVATTVKDATVEIKVPMDLPPREPVARPQPQVRPDRPVFQQPILPSPTQPSPAIPEHLKKPNRDTTPLMLDEIRAQVAARVQARLDKLEAESASKAESESRTKARAKIAKRAIAAAQRQAKLEAKEKVGDDGGFRLRRAPKTAKEMLTAAWFYTVEGNRLGPVSFDELKELASAATLNPRLDMVWWEGMPAWLPAGEIPGLFTRSSPGDEPAKYIEPLAPTPQPIDQPLPAISLNHIAWAGTRRPAFIFVALVFPVLFYFGITAATPALIAEFKPELMNQILPFVPLVPLLLGFLFGLDRLTNLGMNRWWGLAAFIPLVNLWLGYRCFACPAGYAYVKKLDVPGVLIAIVYWILALAATVVTGAYIGMFTGQLKNPEVLKLLHKFLPAV